MGCHDGKWIAEFCSTRPLRTASDLYKIEWWGVGVVICLERGEGCLHTVQLMLLHNITPSSLASFKSSKFPLLQELARDTPSQSASSVPVENMFSTMVRLLNGKRSALAPHRANWLSFIHDNFSLYFKTQNDDVWSRGLLFCVDTDAGTVMLCDIVSSSEVWLFGSLTILSPKWRNWTSVLVCITALCYKKTT